MSARRRIKDVACVLCGEATRDVKAVCGDCRRLRQVGSEIEAAQSVAGLGLETATIHQYVRLWPTLGVPKADEDRVMRLIRAIAGAVPARASSAKADLVVGTIRPGIDRTYTQYLSHWLVPQGRAALMHDLVEAIRDLAAYNYDQGYNAADRLLTRIANDELSVSQINDATAKRK